MQDLLNEKEFLQKPYNPWKVFYIFYAIAFVEVMFLHFIRFFYDSDLLFISGFLFPLITSLLMFFWTKKNSNLPFNTIAYAILLIFAVYFAGIMVVKFLNRPLDFFSDKTVGESFTIGIPLFVYYAIILGIIAVHLKIKRDVAKVKSSESVRN